VSETYASISIWLADIGTGETVQLTPWRNGLFEIPSSYSPDGSHLAFTRFVGHGNPQAMTLNLADRTIAPIAPDALEPVYSPDGSTVAFVRGPWKQIVRRKITRHSSEVDVSFFQLTDIYAISLTGGGMQRLTNTSRAVESSPHWDPSGHRLVYTKFMPYRSALASFGFGDEIWEINSDGTCAKGVLFADFDSIFLGAAWQPGPGREAGPISC
jgi:Tol biopolymer transport system component